MRLGRPHGFLSLATATVATALGTCAVGASVMAPVALGTGGYWLLAGVGVVALVGGLGFLAISLGRRDGLQ